MSDQTQEEPSSTGSPITTFGDDVEPTVVFFS